MLVDNMWIWLQLDHWWFGQFLHVVISGHIRKLCTGIGCWKGAGVDNILIAQEGTQDRFQLGLYNTGGGQESHTQNGSALLQEVHVAFTIDNGGINALVIAFT